MRMSKDEDTWATIERASQELDSVQQSQINVALKEMQSKKPKIMDPPAKRDFIIKRHKKSTIQIET